MAAGAIMMAKKRKLITSGNKFKRKFIETKSRGSSSSSGGIHVNSTTVSTATATASANAIANASSSVQQTVPPELLSETHNKNGRNNNNNKNKNGDEEENGDTRNGTATNCPPCGDANSRIAAGFVTEWINAYIFLARKLERAFIGVRMCTVQRNLNIKTIFQILIYKLKCRNLFEHKVLKHLMVKTENN